MSTFVIVGYGTVGQAHHRAAEWHGHECVGIIDPPKGMTLGGYGDADFAFFCLPTPTEAGVVQVDHIVAGAIRYAQDQSATIIAVRSTVPPGTCRSIQESTQRPVLSNPEFLRAFDPERGAVNPAAVMIGGGPKGKHHLARQRLATFYGNYVDSHDQIILTDWESAEFAKYASNALLAANVCLADELAQVAKSVGADWNAAYRVCQLGELEPKTVRVDEDDRGFGGHCLPKDLEALNGFGETELLKHIQEYNERLRGKGRGPDPALTAEIIHLERQPEDTRGKER